MATSLTSRKLLPTWIESANRFRTSGSDWIDPKHLFIALSLSNLVFLPVWSQLIGGSLDERTSYGLACAASLIAIVLDILVVATCFYFATLYLRRKNTWSSIKCSQSLFWVMFLLSLASAIQPFIPFARMRGSVGDLSVYSYLLLGCSAAVACASARVRKLKPALIALSVTPIIFVGNTGPIPIAAMLLILSIIIVVIWSRSALRVASAIALVMFPFLLISLFQAAMLIVKFAERPRAGLVAKDSAAPKVVWIVFDGLDYKVSFEHRRDDLNLPALDRLRSSSLFATNAYPPADFTMMSLPALLSGRLVSSTSPEGPANLMITYADSATPVSWSDQPSIFSRARELGVNTAIVGWYHPYCRIIGDQVAECLSCNTDRGSLPLMGFTQALTALRENPLIPKLSLLNTLESERQRWREELIASYQEILTASLKSISNRNLGLTVLHLPIPHPPAIFDRDTNDFDASGTASYLDDLVLVDNTVGILRRSMEEAGTWEDAVVVVSSDHWWRGDLWRSLRNSRASGWTEEDESTFSEVDERVPFILKLPRQHESVNYSPEFNTVLTHDLILALLKREVMSPSNTVSWLDHHRTIGRSPYKYHRPQ